MRKMSVMFDDGSDGEKNYYFYTMLTVRVKNTIIAYRKGITYVLI